MPTANVNLSEQQAKLIKQAIKGGRFQNSSEVVRAGLHLLFREEEIHRIRVERLRRMVDEGFADFDRGDYITVTDGNIDKFLDSASPIKRKKSRR